MTVLSPVVQRMSASLKSAAQKALLAFALLATLLLATSCERNPELHLHDDSSLDIDLPIVDIELDVYWDYELNYDIEYDWRAEWSYGWDEIDEELFGPIGYSEPDVFQLRRYFTGDEQYGKHSSVVASVVYGKEYYSKYDFGFWDILVWNEIITPDNVQSLNFDESSTLDYVTAYTNETSNAAHYNKTRSRSFYQPEELFSAYDTGLEINRNMDGFTFDEERQVWFKKLSMKIEPITYIYLTQVILHNNNGKIADVDGSANLSGMARSVRLNNGIAGDEPITVYYNVRMKKHCTHEGDDVDIIGGRMLTFGMCNINANRVSSRTDGFVTRVEDGVHHYMDVKVQFQNGRDSTFVFDVTEQVQQRYKGGVLTVELDCDTIQPPPSGSGSGFDASVDDWEDGGTHEIPM